MSLADGVTGLLFVLLNQGHSFGAGLQLEDPLDALRKVSCDPRLRVRVRLVDGRELTALEIQQSYLDEVEPIVRAGSFPEWTLDVLRHWGETLATLAKDPLRMARKLDPHYNLLA